MRNDKFMAGSADVHPYIVDNQILEMDEFAANPHSGNGIEEVGPLGNPRADLGRLKKRWIVPILETWPRSLSS